MKRRLLFLIALLSFFSSSLLAQDAEEQKILSDKDDTAKVNRLLDYGRTFLDADNKKAVELFETSISISKKIHYDMGLAAAYRKIGYVNGQEGEYKKAIGYYRNAIYYYGPGGPLKDILICYNNIGANYRQIGKLDSTMHYYLLGIKKLEAWPMEKEDAATRLDMLTTSSLLHENISTLYGNMGFIAKALEYGNKAINIAKQVNDTVRIVLSMVSTSNAYYVDKKFEQSLSLSREAAKLSLLEGSPIPVAKAYHLLSVSYTGLGKLDSAIYAAKISMEHARNSDQQLYITSFMDLADAYHDKKEYKKEEKLLETGAKEFESVDNISFGRNIFEKLADLKYAQGQYKEAYDYFVKSIKYKDSMLSQQNRDAVAELEVQYQTAQKEKALSGKQLLIAQKEVQLQKSRQYTLYSIGATLVALLVAGLVYANFKHKRKLHQRQLQSLQKEKELQLLQALMQGEEKERSRIAKDLHDGVAGMLAASKMHFNSLLLNDGALEHTAEYRQAVQLLDEASLELRKTAHNLMPEVLTQYGLNEALRRYCSSINNSKTLTVQYDSWGNMERYIDSFELSVYRIVQELLNNIIKHSKASEAIVQVSENNKVLSIAIEDNGVGFQEKIKKDGMGLQSLQSRVKAMNGKMELEMEAGSGVSAYLEFDVTGLEKEKLYAAN